VALTSTLADDMSYLRTAWRVANDTAGLIDMPHANTNGNYEASKIAPSIKARVAELQWADRRLFEHVLKRRHERYWESKAERANVVSWSFWTV